MRYLLARGDFEVGVKWGDGKLTSATIKNLGQKADLDVMYAGKTVHLSLNAGQSMTLDAQLQLK